MPRHERIEPHLVEAGDELGDGIVGAAPRDQRRRLIRLAISDGEERASAGHLAGGFTGRPTDPFEPRPFLWSDRP